jgi:hypothetical protein
MYGDKCTYDVIAMKTIYVIFVVPTLVVFKFE